MRDLPIRKQIRSESEKLIVNPGKQARHIKNSEGYVLGRSYITVSNAELQDIVNRYAGTGEIVRSSKGKFMNREIITVDREIGISIDPQTQEETPTNRAYILIYIIVNLVRMLYQQQGRKQNDKPI